MDSFRILRYNFVIYNIIETFVINTLYIIKAATFVAAFVFVLLGFPSSQQNVLPSVSVMWTLAGSKKTQPFG